MRSKPVIIACIAVAGGIVAIALLLFEVLKLSVEPVKSSTVFELQLLKRDVASIKLAIQSLIDASSTAKRSVEPVESSTVLELQLLNRDVASIKQAIQSLTDASSEKERLNRVLAGGWDAVSLTRFDRLAKALETWIAVPISEGNSGGSIDERKLYVALARLPSIKRICEIGFNAGHSASLWLLANPKATVTMFDSWRHQYAAKGEAFLRSVAARPYGLVNASARLQIIKGPSQKAVPAYSHRHPGSCDLISIDGDHSFDGAVKDLRNVLPLVAGSSSLVLLDDTNCKPSWCTSVDKARDEVIADGHYEILLRLTEANGARGVTLMRPVD